MGDRAGFETGGDRSTAEPPDMTVAETIQWRIDDAVGAWVAAIELTIPMLPALVDAATDNQVYGDQR